MLRLAAMIRAISSATSRSAISDTIVADGLAHRPGRSAARARVDDFLDQFVADDAVRTAARAATALRRRHDSRSARQCAARGGVATAQVARIGDGDAVRSASAVRATARRCDGCNRCDAAAVRQARWRRASARRAAVATGPLLPALARRREPARRSAAASAQRRRTSARLRTGATASADCGSRSTARRGWRCSDIAGQSIVVRRAAMAARPAADSRTPRRADRNSRRATRAELPSPAVAAGRLRVAHLRLAWRAMAPGSGDAYVTSSWPFSSEKLFHAVNHHLRLEWFREHVARTRRRGAGLIDRLECARQQDHGNVGELRAALHVRGDFVAVALGHVDVGQDDVRRIGIERDRSPAARRRPRHVDVLVGKRQLDDALDRDAVVGEEKLMRHPRSNQSMFYRPEVPAALASDARAEPCAKACSDEIDDFLHGRARAEHCRDAHRLQRRQSASGMMPPSTTSTSFSPFSRSSSISRGQMDCARPTESTGR